MVHGLTEMQATVEVWNSIDLKLQIVLAGTRMISDWVRGTHPVGWESQANTITNIQLAGLANAS